MLECMFCCQHRLFPVVLASCFKCDAVASFPKDLPDISSHTHKHTHKDREQTRRQAHPVLHTSCAPKIHPQDNRIAHWKHPLNALDLLPCSFYSSTVCSPVYFDFNNVSNTPKNTHTHPHTHTQSHSYH